MRPSSKPTGAVWRLLSEWRANHPLRPNQSQMAGLFGISTSLMSNWKYMESVMQADEMELIAQKTGIDIALIARAVAEDKKAGGSGAQAAANKPPDVTPQLAVASGDQNDISQATEADRLAAAARAEQEEAIEEMNRKKRDKEK